MGSNLGDRLSLLRQAVALIERTFSPIRLSAVYRSVSLYDGEQPDYFNLCVELVAHTTPEHLLSRVHAWEQALGRPYPREKNRGPRTVDIDILLMGQRCVRTPTLTIPHSAYLERAFVLLPLLELDPQLRDPPSQALLSDILGRLSDQGVYSIGPLL